MLMTNTLKIRDLAVNIQRESIDRETLNARMQEIINLCNDNVNRINQLPL